MKNMNRNRNSKNDDGDYQLEYKKRTENTREILKDISKIDVTRKKRKIKHTRIRYDIKKYIFKQFADKRTSGTEKRSLRNVVVKADKKFK